MPGVSSTKKSTPVTRCIAWILRPSLPIIRPFISSSGSLTAVTVRSAVTSLAMRSIVSTRIVCARSSASASTSCCILATRFSRSPLMSRSVIFINLSAASFFLRPAIFSSFSCWRVRISRISFFNSSTSSSCLRNFSLRLSSWSSFLSSDSSRSARRFSVFWSSLRRSFSIRSASSLALSTISLALRSACAMTCSAVFLLLVSCWRSYTTLPPTPAIIPTIAAIIPSTIFFLSFAAISQHIKSKNRKIIKI